MPKGIIINCGAVIIGGIVGLLLKKIIPDKLKSALFVYFGFGAMAIGIISIVKLKSLPVVVLSLILGAVIGELLNIEGGIRKGIKYVLNKFAQEEKGSEKLDNLAMAFAIFCFSGTGLYGALNEGFTGDSSVLMAKSALDFFTAAIFATSAGIAISLISIPQFLIFICLYFGAKGLGQRLSSAAISNFISIGGIITFMLGISIAKIKQVKVLNCIPSFLIVVLMSFL